MQKMTKLTHPEHERERERVGIWQFSFEVYYSAVTKGRKESGLRTEIRGKNDRVTNSGPTIFGDHLTGVSKAFR